MLRIVKSLLTIVAVATIATGATGAYFTDSKSIAGNSFTTGRLAITDNTPSYYHVAFTDLKPGDTITKSVVLTNTGSLPIDYLTANKINVVDADGLLSQIPVSVSANVAGADGAFFTPDWTGGTTVGAFFADSNILDAPSYYRTPAGIINVGQDYVVGIRFTIPTTLGNEWQNRTASFDLVFTGEQSHTGTDTF
ncbi:MAG: TasA family protein [Candidatus Berkelbacteria bacterium]